MILEVGEDDHKTHVSEDFTITTAEGSDIKVFEKGIAGHIDYSSEKITNTTNHQNNFESIILNP